ncbi:MAG: GerW family sporulation protein [Oscillospiraceae bacterium]
MSEQNEKHPIGDLMQTTMDKLKEMVDVNTIVGEPIHTDDGITLVPISRLSFGFASGGTDFNGKNQKPDSANNFGGGSGAAVNIAPVGFLVIRDGTVKMLPIGTPPYSTADRVIEMVPDLVDKVADLIGKKKDEDKESF